MVYPRGQYWLQSDLVKVVQWFSLPGLSVKISLHHTCSIKALPNSICCCSMSQDHWREYGRFKNWVILIKHKGGSGEIHRRH